MTSKLTTDSYKSSCSKTRRWTMMISCTTERTTSYWAGWTWTMSVCGNHSTTYLSNPLCLSEWRERFMRKNRGDKVTMRMMRTDCCCWRDSTRISRLWLRMQLVWMGCALCTSDRRCAGIVLSVMRRLTFSEVSFWRGRSRRRILWRTWSTLVKTM